MTPVSLDADRPIVRNTPTLLYAPLAAAQLWDGRLASAERQAIRVIHTATEMGLSPGELGTKLGDDPAYRALFENTFGRAPRDADVARALVAYQIEQLVPGRAPIDDFDRGDDNALEPAWRRGLDVFAGVGRCARCHVPPSFGGSRPTDFAVPVYAALGVLERPGGGRLDDDLGRRSVTGRAADDRVFKTPTVRNVALTGPYFHHGGYPTLESVVAFYQEGGGRGAGLDVPGQDPDVRPLGLTAAQRADLLAFLRDALRDAPHAP